jgi:hypothetical protein
MRATSRNTAQAKGRGMRSPKGPKGEPTLRVLVRHEPIASIVQEALEGYATGRFQLKSEVKDFLESRPEYPRYNNGYVRQEEVARLLSRIIYAGYVDPGQQEMCPRDGKHTPGEISRRAIGCQT